MHILFTGIIIALLITETTGYSPGGIIAAGYLALFFQQPVWLLGTFAAAFTTYLIVTALTARILLYGRRLFSIYVLTGMLISQAALLLSQSGAFDAGVLVIGYLVPGLLARDFARQGTLPTLAVTVLAVAVTRLIGLAGEGLLW